MLRARLRGRLLFLVALAVIPAFALIVYSALEQRRTAVVEAQDAALRLATRIADEQEGAFEATRHLLHGLTKLPLVRARDGSACSRIFADLLKEFPRYTNLAAVTPDGDMFCSGTPLSVPVRFPGNPLMRRAIETRQFVVGDVVARGGISGKPRVIVGMPALDDSGQVVALVVAGLELGWLNDRVGTAALPADTTVLVVDGRGSIVHRVPENLGVIGQDLAATEPVRTALRSDRGVARGPGADGVRRLSGFAGFGAPGARIVVVASTPEALALAPSTHALGRNLAILAAVGLGVFAIAWFGAELSARLRESAALVAIARVVGGTPDLSEALRLISRELARLTGADTVAAFLIPEDRSVLLPVAAYHVPKGAPGEVAKTHLPLGELRLPADVFEGGGVLWTANVAADPRLEGFIFRTFSHQSAALVPLRLDGQTWGGFYLIWWTEERRFADDELALLDGISRQVGVLLRTVRQCQEVEARRRSAEAAKERYRLLFDRNLAGVFRTMRDGRVLECNDAFARMMALSSCDDARGRSARDFYAVPAERDVVLGRLDEDRRILNHEIRLRRTNGDVFWALLNTIKVTDDSGEYFEGITIDIGARKHAEEAERKGETLRSVAALANAAAHAINNPLAIMVGHLEIEALRTQDPATRERLAKVRAAAQRIRDIVARMRRITRLEIADDPPGLPERLDIDRSTDAG
jgi:PAS domain S-box-containing protein